MANPKRPKKKPLREPPAWHGPSAQKAFRELRRIVTDDQDWTAFEVIAAALGEYRDAVEQLQVDGRTAPGERGGVKAHPLLAYSKSQYDAVLKGLCEFGLTPRSRGTAPEVELEHGPDGDPATLVDRILKGRQA